MGLITLTTYTYAAEGPDPSTSWSVPGVGTGGAAISTALKDASATTRAQAVSGLDDSEDPWLEFYCPTSIAVPAGNVLNRSYVQVSYQNEGLYDPDPEEGVPVDEVDEQGGFQLSLEAFTRNAVTNEKGVRLGGPYTFLFAPWNVSPAVMTDSEAIVTWSVDGAYPTYAPNRIGQAWDWALTTIRLTATADRLWGYHEESGEPVTGARLVAINTVKFLFFYERVPNAVILAVSGGAIPVMRVALDHSLWVAHSTMTVKLVSADALDTSARPPTNPAFNPDAVASATYHRSVTFTAGAAEPDPAAVLFGPTYTLTWDQTLDADTYYAYVKMPYTVPLDAEPLNPPAGGPSRGSTVWSVAKSFLAGVGAEKRAVDFLDLTDDDGIVRFKLAPRWNFIQDEGIASHSDVDTTRYAKASALAVAFTTTDPYLGSHDLRLTGTLGAAPRDAMVHPYAGSTGAPLLVSGASKLGNRDLYAACAVFNEGGSPINAALTVRFSVDSTTAVTSGSAVPEGTPTVSIPPGEWTWLTSEPFIVPTNVLTLPVEDIHPVLWFPDMANDAAITAVRVDAWGLYRYPAQDFGRSFTSLGATPTLVEVKYRVRKDPATAWTNLTRVDTVVYPYTPQAGAIAELPEGTWDVQAQAAWYTAAKAKLVHITDWYDVATDLVVERTHYSLVHVTTGVGVTFPVVSNTFEEVRNSSVLEPLGDRSAVVLTGYRRGDQGTLVGETRDETKYRALRAFFNDSGPWVLHDPLGRSWVIRPSGQVRWTQVRARKEGTSLEPGHRHQFQLVWRQVANSLTPT